MFSGRPSGRCPSVRYGVNTYFAWHDISVYSGLVDYWPSWTGGVLGTVPSVAISSSHAHGRPQDFFQGRGKFRDARSWRPILVVTLKTHLHCNHCIMHKTLYSVSRGQVPSKRFIFSKGATVFVEEERLCHGKIAQRSVQAWLLDFNETCHEHSTREWELMKTEQVFEVKGQRSEIVTRLVAIMADARMSTVWRPALLVCCCHVFLRF